MSTRVAGFSDAVFAITATIKVIPIKVYRIRETCKEDSSCNKHSFVSLSSQLHDNAFAIAMYFAAFYMVFIIWKNHVLLFDRLKTTDDNVVWLNMLLLLLATFIPYPLTVLGDFQKDPDAYLLNVVSFGFIAFIQMIMVFYTNRRQTLLSEVFKRRNFDRAGGRLKEILKRYTTWHDMAIASRVNIIWVTFLLGYIASFHDYKLGLGLLGTVFITGPLLDFLERRCIGLQPLTRFLSREVAMERMLMFADGVYSITMTLIVLDICGKDRLQEKDLHGEGKNLTYNTLREVLVAQKRQYVAYILSFTVVAVIWMTNNAVLGSVGHLDDFMRMCMSISLSIVGFVPFVSGLLVQYGDKDNSDIEVVVLFSSVVILVASLLQGILWSYACWSKKGKYLTSFARRNRSYQRAIFIKVFILPVCMMLSLTVALSYGKASYFAFNATVFLAAVMSLIHSSYFSHLHAGHEPNGDHSPQTSDDEELIEDIEMLRTETVTTPGRGKLQFSFQED
eukprot:m.340018 g.340018  ORF g.340018 m.340018 type:complete len:506 (+) comp19080_c0_seq1:114-1631(+)